jgi:hypothetical protein
MILYLVAIDVRVIGSLAASARAGALVLVTEAAVEAEGGESHILAMIDDVGVIKVRWPLGARARATWPAAA